MPDSNHGDDQSPDDGCTAPFVALPVAVLQSVIDRKISRDAGWLYACLLSHLNRKRGGNVVWPSRAILASEMGISKAANVDRYLAELEAQGLIAVKRSQSGQMRTRNIYTLRCLPDLRRSPRTGTTASETAGQHVVPELGQRSPNSGTRVVPELGPEQEEEEPDEDSSSLATSIRARIAAVTGCADDEIDAIIETVRKAARGHIRTPAAYFRDIPAEDLRDHLATVRATAAATANMDWRAMRAEVRRRATDMPRCPHEINGGWLVDRDGKVFICGACARLAAADPDAFAAMVSSHGR